VIVDFEATTAIRQAEITAQRRMIDRTQERFGLWPERLVGDAGYGDAKNLSWLVEERGIEPHIQVVDHSVGRNDTFERSAFSYGHEDDSHICPAGKRLRQRQKVYREDRPFVDENGMLRYRSSKLDCDACALKPRCCPTQPARKILRSVHEGARQSTRAPGISPAISPPPTPISSRAASARRSKCCSRTSSASSEWIACACEVQTAQGTSPSSQPPPKTSGKWPS